MSRFETKLRVARGIEKTAEIEMPETKTAAPAPTAPLTLEDIKAILAEPDIVRRNLLVTAGYHRLSHEFARILGYRDANWCTFAVWASRQAGSIVRRDVGGVLGSALEATRLPKGRLDDILTEESQGTLGLMGLVTLISDSFSQATSLGNTDVFNDIAPFVVRFIKSCRNHGDFRKFIGTLSPRPSFDGGQESLVRAAEQYYEALHERNPRTRSQLILAANCQVGAHEQARLDSKIDLAVDAPINRVLGYLTLKYKTGYDLSLVQSGLWSVLRPVFVPSMNWFLRAVWQGIATRHIMRLPLPDETLFLGDDLPRLRGRDFPRDLERLYVDAAIAVVDYFNYAALNTLRGSRAIAWTDFSERMNSIMNLFRSRQQEPSLFRTPFTDEKIKEMSAGVRADWTDGDIPPFTRAELAELERSWRPPPFTPPPDAGGGVP